MLKSGLVTRTYVGILGWSLRHRWVIVLATIATFLVTVGVAGRSQQRGEGPGEASLIRALADSGPVASAKVGPDYIDPRFHEVAGGRWLATGGGGYDLVGVVDASGGGDAYIAFHFTGAPAPMCFPGMNCSGAEGASVSSMSGVHRGSTDVGADAPRSGTTTRGTGPGATAALPIPSNAHWMPLAALVQVPFIWLLGPTALAAASRSTSAIRATRRTSSRDRTASTTARSSASTSTAAGAMGVASWADAPLAARAVQATAAIRIPRSRVMGHLRQG